MNVTIRNFKVPKSCYECIVKCYGICDLNIDEVVKMPTYLSARHPDCPITYTTKPNVINTIFKRRK